MANRKSTPKQQLETAVLETAVFAMRPDLSLLDDPTLSVQEVVAILDEAAAQWAVEQEEFFVKSDSTVHGTRQQALHSGTLL